MNKLQNKVLEQLKLEELNDESRQVLSDIANYGVDGGFTGFTSYTDTVKFFKDNKELILDEVKEIAFSLGDDPLAMVAGFNCLKYLGINTFEVAEAIYESGSEYETEVKNALSWFAAEQVAFQLEAE